MKRRTWWALAATVGLLAFGASVTGLPNQFTYDDVFVIQKDARVHTLVHWWHFFADTYWSKQMGGDGYRPLTILGFAVQWVTGHGSPLIFHVVNVALYVALCVAVFWLLTGVLPSVPAWIAAALFAVHPLHTEAVANIVGQSELTVGLLLTLAMGLYVYGRERGPLSRGRQIAIAAMYAAAMFFKEHGIVLVALVVAAELTVVRDRRPLRTRLTELRPFILALVAIAMAFLWARGRVLSGRFDGFRPYVPFQTLHLSTPDRILTMIGVAPQWGRLFLWPAHLTTEYSPPWTPVAQGPSIDQLPGLLLMIGVIGLAFATWRRLPAASFGLGWLIVAMSPVSNLVLPAGFIIAERTLLLPSVGVMIFLGALVPAAYEWLAAHRLQAAGAAAIAALLALGIWRSDTRSRLWHDNDVLFKREVIDTPDSYRTHFMLGAWLMQHKRMREGEAEYNKGMRLFPFDPMMAVGFADDYGRWNICKPAINLYRWALSMDSTIAVAWAHMADCLLVDRQYQAAKKAAVNALRHHAPIQDMHNILVWADSAQAASAAGRERRPGKMPGSVQNPGSGAFPGVAAATTRP